MGWGPRLLGLREEGLGAWTLRSLSYLPSPGCTVVVLVPPASPTPLLLAQLAGELGAFPGILNVLSGPTSLAPVLASRSGVQKVAFCGSVEVSSGLGG